MTTLPADVSPQQATPHLQDITLSAGHNIVMQYPEIGKSDINSYKYHEYNKLDFFSRYDHTTKF